MSDKQILIRQPFNEQYTLLIEMESMLVNSSLKSKTEARYDFSVIKLENNIIECRLVQLDLFIKESNNALIKEIADVTSAFNRMFNELHLKINNKGEITEVLNLNLILSKWDQTKAAMETAASKNEDLKKFIIINDNLFTDPEKIKIAIQANEFLQVYFGDAYGVDLPNMNKIVNRTNFFNTAYLQWKVSTMPVETSPYSSGMVTINTTGNPFKTPDQEFNKSAYKQFEEQLDTSKLNTTLSENASHMVDVKSGRLNKAEIIKKEVADHQKLFMYLKYSMKSDSANKESKSWSVPEPKKDSRYHSKSSFFIDDNDSKT